MNFIIIDAEQNLSGQEKDTIHRKSNLVILGLTTSIENLYSNSDRCWIDAASIKDCCLFGYT